MELSSPAVCCLNFYSKLVHLIRNLVAWQNSRSAKLSENAKYSPSVMDRWNVTLIRIQIFSILSIAFTPRGIVWNGKSSEMIPRRKKGDLIREIELARFVYKCSKLPPRRCNDNSRLCKALTQHSRNIRSFSHNHETEIPLAFPSARQKEMGENVSNVCLTRKKRRTREKERARERVINYFSLVDNKALHTCVITRCRTSLSSGSLVSMAVKWRAVIPNVSK